MKNLSIFILFLVVTFFTGMAFASRYLPIINNYHITNEYNTFDSGASDSDLDSSFAALMAADAIHCTTSTRKNQMGVGTGYRSGKNGYAVGYCKTIDRGGTPLMFGVKAAGSSGQSPAYGAGLNWTF